MARDRSHDEILDQMVYAVACVARHYGPGLSSEGLAYIRQQLGAQKWWCDSTWRVDTFEGSQEPNPDFCPKILRDGIGGLYFDSIVQQSRTGEE